MRIKVIYSSLAFLLCLFSAIGVSAQDKINWLSWDQAIEANKKAPKKIFIDVYTDWCGWCKRMDATTFSNPSVVNYINANYYAVKLDAEMKDTIQFMDHTFINPSPERKRSTHQLAASLLDNNLSYPSFVLMNEKIERLQILKGYHQPGELNPILKYFGEDIYLDTPYEEYIKSAK